MAEKRRIGISILSLITNGFLGPDCIRRSIDIIDEAGLDGLQLLPLWGISASSLQDIDPRYVMSYESDFRRSIHGVPKKSTLSSVLFGGPSAVASRISMFQKYFPNALAIDVNPDSLMETSMVNSERPSDYYQHQPGVVLDTYHVLELEQRGIDIPVFLSCLLQYGQIRLIHYQTRSTDLGRLLKGRCPTLETAMLRGALKSGADVIIELLPQALLFNCVASLRTLRFRLGELDGQC